MVMAAIVFGFAFKGRRYPHRPQRLDRASYENGVISHEAVVAAVRSMDTFLDISEEDLIKLHSRMLIEEQRMGKK
jgi:CBS-domain-containing membrane protein